MVAVLSYTDWQNVNNVTVLTAHGISHAHAHKIVHYVGLWSLDPAYRA